MGFCPGFSCVRLLQHLGKVLKQHSPISVGDGDIQEEPPAKASGWGGMRPREDGLASHRPGPGLSGKVGCPGSEEKEAPLTLPHLITLMSVRGRRDWGAAGTRQLGLGSEKL